MEYTLKLTFVTDTGDKVNLIIPAVRADITGEEVSAAMDVIISENIFLSNGGDFKAKYSAQLLEMDVTEWDLV